MKWKCYFLVLAIICLSFGLANAQENFNITSINQYYYHWNDGVSDVCLNGGYAYLACGTDGLRIVDISQPGAIRDIGLCNIGDTNNDWANTVAVSGNYAYLGTYQNGILVIDISNPSAPTIVHTVPFTQSTFRAIRIAGNYAFVCKYGLSIIDISDPASAQVVWESEDQFEIDDIEVHGDTAYAAWGEHGLKIMDLSQITSPQIIGRFYFEDGTWVSSVSISGDYAYLACGSRGFQVLNMKTMQIAAGIDSLYYGFKIKVRDDYAYMTYGDPECPLAIIDISDPYSPQTMGIYYPPQDIVNFAIDGDLIYVADYYFGLRLIDIYEPANPHEEVIYNRYGHDFDITIQNNHAFAREEHRVTAIDIDDPGNPHEVGFYEYDSQTANVCFVGNIAYSCHQANTCLNAVDFSNPASPIFLGSYTAEHDVHYKVGIYDHYAYILENLGLRIVDISDPANMDPVGFFLSSTSPDLLEIIDHYAIFQNGSQEIELLDLTNPIAPTNIGEYIIGQEEYCHMAKASDGRLYLAGSNRLWIFDITNFGNWVQLASMPIFDGLTNYLRGIEIVDNFAYLTVSGKGLCVYDITDAGHPQLVGLYDTPGVPLGVSVTGNIAMVADYTNLGFYDCTQAVGIDDPSAPTLPQSFALLQNYPNPFNSSTTIQFELPKTGNVSLAVYDILGRKISLLANREFTAGQHAIRWDGTADNGKAVASGRYFVRAISGEAVQNIPIMLLK
jgi:hypothetical protein